MIGSSSERNHPVTVGSVFGRLVNNGTVGAAGEHFHKKYGKPWYSRNQILSGASPWALDKAQVVPDGSNIWQKFGFRAQRCLELHTIAQKGGGTVYGSNLLALNLARCCTGLCYGGATGSRTPDHVSLFATPGKNSPTTSAERQ